MEVHWDGGMVALSVPGDWLGLNVEGWWGFAEWIWCCALRRGFIATRRGHGPYR